MYLKRYGFSDKRLNPMVVPFVLEKLQLLSDTKCIVRFRIRPAVLLTFPPRSIRKAAVRRSKLEIKLQNIYLRSEGRRKKVFDR